MRSGGFQEHSREFQDVSVVFRGFRGISGDLRCLLEYCRAFQNVSKAFQGRSGWFQKCSRGFQCVSGALQGCSDPGGYSGFLESFLGVSMVFQKHSRWFQRDLGACQGDENGFRVFRDVPEYFGDVPAVFLAFQGHSRSDN